MLSDFFSRIYRGATHAVGKIKQFGSAVGKHKLCPANIRKCKIFRIFSNIIKNNT